MIDSHIEDNFEYLICSDRLPYSRPSSTAHTIQHNCPAMPCDAPFNIHSISKAVSTTTSIYCIYTTHIVYSHIVYADCRRFSLSLRGVIISLCRYFRVLRTGARLFAKIASKWNAGAMWHAAIYFHLRLRLRLWLRLWLRAPYRFLIVAKLCPKWSIENQIVCSILHNARRGKAAGRQLQVARVRCLSLLRVARSLSKSFATGDFTRLSS